MTFWGEHIHAEEQDPHCTTCPKFATVEVFDHAGRSHGCYCLRCGRRKLAALKHLESLFPRSDT